jgi:DNA-binding NtrC family response regulator/tetratricopeptide (TPR) repeat protein
VAVLGRLIGESPGLVAVRRQVEQLLRRQSGSRRPPPVLILGETGTGKGLLANAIHEAGPRAGGPFVAVNCAAIPETLLEAELFGFEQGAFTDARHAKAGLFQSANRGTVFLDEIGLLPQSLQAKLLTVLEDRTVRRLGSTRSEPVDVWIISATSEDLKAGARRRGFREELYHRLAVVTLHLPPLRERRQDIVILAEHYLARTCIDYGLPPKTLGEDARGALLAYRWPGNVRELANLMERVALLTDGRGVTADVLELGARGRATVQPRENDASPARARAPAASSLERAVGEVERARIVEALQATGGNISHAADRLGVTRNILRYRLKKYGLQTASVTAEPLNPTDAAPPTVEPALPQRAARVQWERRHIALLRADLISAPGGLVSHAGAVLETLVEKITTFGGHVEEVSPRGLVAVFGLEPIEDAPRRAAHAALAIQKIMTEDRGSSANLPNVRIGLHVGHFLVARIENVARLDYEAKREAWTHLEALIGRAGPDTLLISEATYPFLARRFVLEPVGASDESTGRAYQVVGLEPTGLGSSEWRTPFVGRIRELEQFAQALAYTEANHGQAVSVVGEPGVGKSRLLWQFIHTECVRHPLILVGSAASYGKGTPYLPVTGLLKTYFKIEPRDDADTVRERITQKMLSLERGLAPAVPAILALLDVPIDDPHWRRLEPQQKRQQTLEAVKLLLLEETQRQLVIVILEDLHWIDSETQAMLDALVESLPGHRLLLLVSYRPEYHHSWGGKSYYAQLRLDPLSLENAGALLDSRVGRDQTTAELKAALIERTDGNPFFLEESVRTLVETGVLVGDFGAYRLARPVGDIQMPATVQAVLAARVERLSSEDKTLLQTTAVIGKDVAFALIRAVAEVPEERLRASLKRLQASEFLYERRRAAELEYVFKHALSYEVAYGGLLPERRSELHSRIVDAIETLYRDRLDGEIERLAHHALRGELWEKAAHYLHQAGLRAAARSALQSARSWLQQALGALAALPETRSTMEQGVDIRLELRAVLNQLGDPRQSRQHLSEAEALAERLNDDRRRVQIAAMLTHGHGMLGELDEARLTGARALAMSQKLGDVKLQILSRTCVQHMYYHAGEFERAVQVATDNLAALLPEWTYERFGNVTPATIYDRYWLIMNLAQLGRFGEAAARGAEAMQLAESTQHAFPIGLVCFALSTLHLLQGDWTNARLTIERVITVTSAGNIVLHLDHAVGWRALVLAQAGDNTGALNSLQEAERRFAEHATRGFVGLLGWSYQLLGRAQLLLGSPDEAERLGECARRFSQKHPGFDAHALHLLGDIATHPDRLHAESGEAHYRKALALAEPRGMRPLVAHCHLGLGKLYARSGREEHAEEHFSTAAKMYREMNMGFWLEKMKAEVWRRRRG